MNLRWLALLSGTMALIGIFSGLPYSYYILLRWVIFTTACIFAYKYYHRENQGWALTFASVAFLFNPIFPIYLSKSTWVVFDFIIAIIFFTSVTRKQKI